jgi:hypothetical protein
MQAQGEHGMSQRAETPQAPATEALVVLAIREWRPTQWQAEMLLSDEKGDALGK